MPSADARAGVRCKVRGPGVNLGASAPTVNHSGSPLHLHWMTLLKTRTSPSSSMLLTNSNGEYGDGSSNKTPDIVVPIRRAPLVAHILQLLRGSSVRGRRAGERREHFHSTPVTGRHSRAGCASAPLSPAKTVWDGASPRFSQVEPCKGMFAGNGGFLSFDGAGQNNQARHLSNRAGEDVSRSE